MLRLASRSVDEERHLNLQGFGNELKSASADPVQALLSAPAET